MSTELYTETFLVTEVDKFGKKFDRVSRIEASAEKRDMQLTLDVNTEIYSIVAGEKFYLMLSSSLTNSAVSDKNSWRDNLGRPTLADGFEYVMHGKVYKFDEVSPLKGSAFVSFGGLLMELNGDSRLLNLLNVGQDLYLLIRK